MSLFQKSVIKNQLESIDDNDIKEGWDNFQSYKSIINNIKGYKEEEFQFDFLKMIFNDCLGYKISDVGDEQRNLYTEVKNVSDSKKADGAIKKDDKVIAVIELKSPKTRDFKKIQDQAFLYKASHGEECNYIITSNFEKLRFYIDSSSEFEEFNLFNLTKDDFKLLYVCLHKENLFSGLPKKLKDESVLVEENVTKKLYKDYSSFRKELFDSLVKSNAEYDKLTLFNKTQKLLDRFLFIFFAEDRNLVPANSISKIIDKWEDDISFGDSRSLYSIFKQYFNVLNTGRPARGEHEAIFAYNGGLFANDEILDSIEIDDNMLLKHTKNLSHYDFESEISVNILGHIFEHSLSEIEEIQSEISGIKSSTSKRKKDGVFYTPQYITRYMVESTLGKLCTERKNELNINEETYAPSNKRSREKIQNLENYRNWLLKLTICDPACGSGAFLNQALSFLIDEHKYIDELSASYNRDSITLSDVKNSILENNLFGVDINEESIEIAKLSLWLRTAEKGRKLTSLNDKIKCGNSLIDNIDIAGEKAFNWHSEFPEVFVNGGFDVVIGNPPYVNFASLPADERAFFKKTYKVCKNKTDLYAFFVEKSTQILKSNAKFSFIIPHTWVSTISFTPLRKLFFENYRVDKLVELEHGVFQDAIVKTIIIVCEKGQGFIGVPIFNNDFIFKVNIPKKIIFKDEEMTINFDWTSQKQKIEDKLMKGSLRLDSLLRFTRGIKTSNDKRFLHFEKKDDNYKKIIRGRNIKAYRIDFAGEYIWYKPDLMKEKVGSVPHTKELFEVPEKLITQRINSSGQLLVTYDDEQTYSLDTTNVSVIKNELNVDLKYILVILNSKLINWWFNDKFKMPTISGYELHQIPIKVNYEKMNAIVDFGIKKLKQEPFLRDELNKFSKYLKSQFFFEKLSNKLQNWYELEFGDFIRELNKAIKKVGGVKLTKMDEMEWLDIFEAKKEEAQTLISEINKTDREIDQMVYELYGLSKEEIEIVENS